MIHCGAWLRFLRWLCFVIPVLSAGCRRDDPVDAVALLGVDSPVISADSPLELRAEGLPSGRKLQVALHGRLAAAGQDERTLDVSLVGHVLSPERLSIALDPALVARWGRATFEGEVVVDCDALAGRRCHGVLQRAGFDVELVGGSRGQRLHYAVDRLLPTLGLEISDADSATYGLLVSAVQPGSLAARAGLRQGDTIVRSNGVSLHALADLAPGPSADGLALQVRRGGGPLTSMRVPLADAPPLADLRLLGLCLVASPLLLLLLTRLGMPAPSVLTDGLETRAALVRRAGKWPLGVGAVLSALLGGLSAFAGHAFDPFVLLLVHLGGVVLLRGLSGDGARRLGADALGVWAGMLCVAAVSGTRAWPILLRDQGALPWAWNALSRLPLSAACALFLVSAARLHSCERASPQPMAAQLWEQGLCALLSALCAGLFFGGAYVAPGASAPTLWLTGALAAAKGVLCYGLLRMLAGVRLARPSKWLWIGIVAVTPLWVRLAPSRSFESTWGSAVCVLLGSILVAGLVSSRIKLDAPQPKAAAAATPKPPAPQPVARRGTAARQVPVNAATTGSTGFRR
jgi:hypothetical protein